ncbi:protein NTM1-like 9 isoform X1 [Populus alba]|uniref:protein NTM1-like 9 isoform X1 n=1 Tax=Populus alba TaxID=43335 RepID=UPI0015887CDB|nr:protein NTM1-like 9 isoform X1 [Populus alba]
MKPVGYRFRPTEEEIIDHYLMNKLKGLDSLVDAYIGEIDYLYQWDPWDLPDFAVTQSDDRVWHFFCRHDYKYSNSKRVNRTTRNGNWKLTGKVRDIKRRGTNEVIGTKKNLVFQRKCPDSKKTGWVIHEFQVKTSPPDERALVLCKLKHKADDSAANSPNDEGEPSRFMGSVFENNAAATNILGVDAEQLLSLVDSDGEDFNCPSPLQSQIYDEGEPSRFRGSVFENNAAETNILGVDEEQPLSLFDNDWDDFNCPSPLQSQIYAQNYLSDEEDPNEFVDSLFVDPDEYGTEHAAFSLLDDHSSPRSSRKAYAAGSSDRTTYHVNGESANLYGGRGNLKISRQLQMAHGDDILLMGASSTDSTTATRHEHVKLMQSGGEVISRTRQPPPPVAPSFVERKEVSHKRVQSLRGVSKAGEGRKESADIDLPRKESFGRESETDRRIVPVTNAKPRAKSRSNELGGNDRKGRFIQLEITISSHGSSPLLVFLVNAVLGLLLFIIMLREALIVH